MRLIPCRCWAFLFVSLLVMCVPVGCAKKTDSATAHLAGSVTVGGKSLPNDAEGYIQFMPNDGGQAQPTSTEIHDGMYDAENVPLGSVTAIFNITRLTGKMVREDNAPGATPYPERENLVPAKHQAGVQVQVEGDNDAHDFEL